MDYFLLVIPIWTAYFKGKISMAERENALAPHRLRLKEEMRMNS